MKRLLTAPSSDDLTCLLRAWRLWLVAALLGGLIGMAIFFLSPPMQRARATVVVDFNLEEAWPDAETDRDLYYFLERETRKLEEVAWSDAVMQAVQAEVPNLALTTLRGERLHLSQPQDGGWHFYADDADPVRAERLAAAWASAFTEQVRAGVATAQTLQRLQAGLAEGQSVDEAQLSALEEASFGITPYVQVAVTQQESLPVVPKAALGEYVAFGSLAAAILTALWTLFFAGAKGNAR